MRKESYLSREYFHVHSYISGLYSHSEQLSNNSHSAGNRLVLEPRVSFVLKQADRETSLRSLFLRHFGQVPFLLDRELKLPKALHGGPPGPFSLKLPVRSSGILGTIT